MKLAKISLATLVALGAFSSVASATPLEEAIKNVDVSGFARYRYENVNTEETVGSKTSAGHKFKFITNFKAAIDDNFFGVVGLRYNKADGSGNAAAGVTDTTVVNNGGNLNIHQLYLGYTYGNTTVTAGKQVIGTFFTDDAIGTGAKIVNKDIEGLTLAAIAFDALENDAQESDGALLGFARGKQAAFKKLSFIAGTGALDPANTTGTNAEKSYDAGNLYGVAAMGSYDPISFQLWYASLTNVTDLLALELAGDFDVTNDINVGFKGQFVNSDADSSIKKAAPDYNDGKFYAGELSTELYGVSLAAGYIGYKVDDRGITSFSFEDQGSLIDVAEQRNDYVLDYTLIGGKGNFWFAKLGYGIDKFDLGVDYIAGTAKYKGGKETDYQEVMPSIAYKYSKKLKFSTFYSWANIDEKGKDDYDSTKYRFEAKYSF
ncbi:major outer membrane protein [Campylobacter californiensis]|uniref:major outer membrane protein n=1 Tax=Campylobacter californiensis TaxID=1032243 RepID=UPI0014763A7B|nr:major outer membrane protein [Campylobacter sp. RM12916]MBE3610077.1 major outer membrane protein [Campylobacter sp. RM12916]